MSGLMLDAAAALAPCALLSRDRYSVEAVRSGVKAGAQEAAQWLKDRTGEYGAGLLQAIGEEEQQAVNKLAEILTKYHPPLNRDRATNDRALAEGFLFLIGHAYSFADTYSRLDCVAEMAGYLAIPPAQTMQSSRRAMVRAGARAAAEVCKKLLTDCKWYEAGWPVRADGNDLFLPVFRLFCGFDDGYAAQLTDSERWDCFDLFYSGFVYVFWEANSREK